MSQPKSRDVLRWRDENGNVHESAQWKPTRGTSLASLSDRIVDAYCPRGHLAASLLPTSDPSRPVVMVHNALSGPAAMLVLADGALYGALVRDGQIFQLGRPRDDFVLDCPTCLTADYVLDGPALSAASRSYAGKTRRIGLRAVT